jgi:hypothetical protein
MESQASPKIFGSTVFCDDIRREEAGKISLIGVYRGALLANAPFPIVLPKFGFAISYHHLRSSKKPAIGPVEFCIFLPGDDADSPSITGQIPLQEPPPEDPARLAELISAGERAYIRANAEVVVAGLLLKSVGVIKVRAIAAGKMYRIGALRVEQGVLPRPPAPGGANPT